MLFHIFMVSDSMQSFFYKENKGTMQYMLAFVKPTPKSVFALFTKHQGKLSARSVPNMQKSFS